MIALGDLDADERLNFEEFKQVIKMPNFWPKLEQLPLLSNNTTEMQIKTLISGGVAGAVSRTVVAPFERIKILFQTQAQASGSTLKYRGIYHTLITIYKEEGLVGYFKGNGINCLRIIPTSAIQFYSYEQFKRVSSSDIYT
jgi:hypothetical protein